VKTWWNAWRVVFIALVFGGAVSQMAVAQDYGASASHFRILRIHHHEDIAADHTAVRTQSVEREALSAEGAVAIGKFAVSFNPDLESLDILEAYTEKGDGRRIMVRPEDIHRQTGKLAEGTGISWPSLNTVQVVFPQVRTGDKTHVRYRQTIRRPALEKGLSWVEYLPNQVDILAYQVSLSAPAEFAVQVVAEHMDLHSSVQGGRRIWTIRGSSSGFSDEPQLANALKQLPYWMYSTWPSRTALADAFAKGMRDKLMLSPSLQAMAEGLVQGKSTPQQKVQAIHQWMVQEMRYVAIFVGTGGYVPHDLPTILDNRYGDCKDMSLLMMALLKAVGVESAPALINTFQTDWVPPVPVELYNHVIVYIPSLNLFVDPTAQKTPLGALPWADAAKPVLVGFETGAREMRTPVFERQDNLVRVQSNWAFDRQGNAKVDMVVHTSGQAASELQDQLEQIPLGLGFAAVQRFLKKAGLTGTGTLNHPAVQRLRQVQEMSVELTLQAFLNSLGSGSVNPHPMISSLPVYVQSNLGPVFLPGRQFDALCVPLRVEEVFTLAFPEEVQLLNVPVGISENRGGIQYQSEYNRTAHGLEGKRTFERLPTESGHICSRQEIEARRPVLDAARKDLREVVLFKTP
jgi:hypothetical protein